MTLPFTLDEVRQRETARFGAVSWPQPWWPPGRDSSYCVGWQTITLGLRTGRETAAQLVAHRHLISIAAFRAHYQYPEVSAEQIQAGDLVLSNFSGTRLDDGTLEPEHMEWAYSVDRSVPSIRIVGANTGPRPGQLEPNGIWQKTRPRDEHIVLGIRPPYRDDRPSRNRRHVVQVVAAEVNRAVPPVVHGIPLPRTTAEGPGPDTGLEGVNYWRLVQTWGRIHGYYPSGYVIDGIPGPQSRIVEDAAYKTATSRKK